VPRTDQFTWAVLKAPTTTGELSNYVQQSTGRAKSTSTTLTKATIPEDLQSVVEGVKFVRRMTEQSDLFVKTEMLPGVAIDEEEELKQFIKNEAWGITPVEPVKSDDWMTKWRF